LCAEKGERYCAHPGNRVLLLSASTTNTAHLRGSTATLVFFPIS
jgi:hypothetical protein